MSLDFTYSGNTTSTAVTYWKPDGRARHFDRVRRGLARRLRLPFVRQTLWEREHPRQGAWEVTYHPMWTSTTTLADHSFACVCHKGPRHSRKNDKPKWRQRGHPRREGEA